MKKSLVPLMQVGLLAAIPFCSVPAEQALAEGQNGKEPTAATRTNQAPTSGWSTSCTATGRDAALDCVLEQRLFAPQTGQQILGVRIRVAGAGRELVLMVATPLGLYLPAGVSIRVDKSNPKTLELHTCDAGGCYVVTTLTDELRALMKAGRDFSVSFQNLAKEEINVTMPLQGFSEGLAKVE